jgi:hypothetical protein
MEAIARDPSVRDRYSVGSRTISDIYGSRVKVSASEEIAISQKIDCAGLREGRAAEQNSKKTEQFDF